MPSRITNSNKFAITINDKTYQCERTVTSSKDILDQDIWVAGVGRKHDPASYGPGGHPISSMAGFAKIIAGEIISAAALQQAALTRPLLRRPDWAVEIVPPARK
jgi:hypothetical protein